MIQLQTKPDAPAALKRTAVVDTQTAIRLKATSGTKPVSTDFPSYWLPEARKVLFDHQKHKCCYCERERDENREPDLEHFRPKAGVEGDPVHYGYWWLAYDWDNYLFSCRACNQAFKKNQFPLLNGGIRAYNEGASLIDEKPILINPFDENPEELISFDWEDSNDLLVKAVPTAKDLEERGKRTIEIVGLNRPNLLEERAQMLLTLEAMAMMMMAGLYFDREGIITKATTDILRETSSSKPFTGFRRAYFRKIGLGRFISLD